MTINTAPYQLITEEVLVHGMGEACGGGDGVLEWFKVGTMAAVHEVAGVTVWI